MGLIVEGVGNGLCASVRKRSEVDEDDRCFALHQQSCARSESFTVVGKELRKGMVACGFEKSSCA